jgi:hypothetical protein
VAPYLRTGNELALVFEVLGNSAPHPRTGNELALVLEVLGNSAPRPRTGNKLALVLELQRCIGGSKLKTHGSRHRATTTKTRKILKLDRKATLKFGG